MKQVKQICLIGDNTDEGTLTRLSIQQAYPDHAVGTFNSGMAFIDALPQMSRLPSLILLDRPMPDLDGQQTLSFLKQHPHYKCIPVVMMSAGASEKEVACCYTAGVNSFLFKRVDAALQRETVLSVCEYWLAVNKEPDSSVSSVSDWL